MRYPGRLSLPILLCALAIASALPPSGGVFASSAAPAPRQIILQYFAALNAHRYHAAWLLEASCNTSYPVPNSPGAPVGSISFHGRGTTWVPPPGILARHPILASARVTAIKPLHVPVLARQHILAFGVSGWYRFDYSAVPWANDKHTSGFHVIKLALWKCNGRWGIESGWVSSGGGPLNWS